MNKPFVLVAEDNRVIARAAQLSLRNFDLLVDVASNGAEAVAATRLRNYSLVLMDVEMPVMDGITATIRIRVDEEKTGKRVPIVGVTSIENPLSLISCGMDDCVIKPADYPGLVRTWLDLE
ncbi:MAG: response regulator [Cyanobacteria bacterium SZAS LIN-5]|nr:response regulator [Cyanobacteria bacterium SZAS LIN-5]